MCAWQKSKTKPWLRLVALCTALVFTSTSVLWADGSGPAASSLFSEKKLETLPAITTPASTEFLKEIVLPASMGQIKEQYQGTNGKVIVHIQDAHINEDAQRNIAAILKYFSNTQGLDFIGLEGAEGKIHPEAVSFFPDKKAVTQMADYFLKNGKISGPLYYGITESPKIEFFGIEKQDLYEKNRQAYLDALTVQARDEEILRELKKSLNDVSRYILSPELKEMTVRREEFQKNASQLIPYIRFLEGQAEKQKISIQDYPRVQSLIALMKIEGGVNFENAEQEVTALIQKMKSMVTRDRLTAFLTSTVQYETKRLGRDRYFKILEDESAQIEARSPGFKKAHENAFKYVQYMRLYESISVDVFDEVGGLEKRLKETLFRDDREKRFDHLFTVANVFEKMFAFELTKDDVDFFYQNRGDFSAETFRLFIEPLFEEFHFEKQLPEKMELLDKDILVIERFYSAALERDHVLIENAARRLEAKESNVAAVVTGGFHTPGLERYLRVHGYSYLVITPRITNQIDEAAEGKLYEESLKETPAELAVMLQKALVVPRSSSRLNDPRFQLSARLPFTESALTSFVSAVGDSNTDSPLYYQTVIANEPVTGSSLFLGAAISTLASTQTPAEVNQQIIAGLESTGLPADYMKAATAFIAPFANASRAKGGDSQNAIIAVPMGDSQVLIGTYMNASRSEVRGAVSGQRFLEVRLGNKTTFAAGVGDSAMKPGAINLARSEARQTSLPVKKNETVQKSPKTVGYNEVSAPYVAAAKVILADSNPLANKKSALIKLFNDLKNQFKLSAEKTPKLLNPKGNVTESFVALHQKILLIAELNDFEKRFKGVSDVLRAGKLSFADIRRVQEDGRKVLTALESFKAARDLDLKRLGLSEQISNIEKFHNEIESRASVSRRTAWFFSAIQFLKNLLNRFLNLFQPKEMEEKLPGSSAPKTVAPVETNTKILSAYRTERARLFKPTGTGKGYTVDELESIITALARFAQEKLKENYTRKSQIPKGLIDPKGDLSSSLVALHHQTIRKIRLINFRHSLQEISKSLVAAEGDAEKIAYLRERLKSLNERYQPVIKTYQLDLDRMNLRALFIEVDKLGLDLEASFRAVEKMEVKPKIVAPSRVTTPAPRAPRTSRGSARRSNQVRPGLEGLERRDTPSAYSPLPPNPMSLNGSPEDHVDAGNWGQNAPHFGSDISREQAGVMLDSERPEGAQNDSIVILDHVPSGNVDLNFLAQDRGAGREYFFAISNSNQLPQPTSLRQGTLTLRETHGTNLHVFDFRQDRDDVRVDAILVVDTADASGSTRLYVFEGNTSVAPTVAQLEDGRIQVTGAQGSLSFAVRQAGGREAPMPDAVFTQTLNWATVAPIDLASAAIAGFSNPSDDIAAMFPTTSNVNPVAVGALFGMMGSDTGVTNEPVGAIIKAETVVGGVKVQLKQYPDNIFKVAVIQNGNEFERELPIDGGIYREELNVEVESEDGRRWLKITVRNQQGETVTTYFDLDESNPSRFFEIERVPDVKGNRATIGGPGAQGLTGISGGGSGGGGGIGGMAGAGGGGGGAGGKELGLSGVGGTSPGEEILQPVDLTRSEYVILESRRIGTEEFLIARVGDERGYVILFGEENAAGEMAYYDYLNAPQGAVQLEIAGGFDLRSLRNPAILEVNEVGDIRTIIIGERNGEGARWEITINRRLNPKRPVVNVRLLQIPLQEAAQVQEAARKGLEVETGKVAGQAVIDAPASVLPTSVVDDFFAGQVPSQKDLFQALGEGPDYTAGMIFPSEVNPRTAGNSLALVGVLGMGALASAALFGGETKPTGYTGLTTGSEKKRARSEIRSIVRRTFLKIMGTMVGAMGAMGLPIGVLKGQEGQPARPPRATEARNREEINRLNTEVAPGFSNNERDVNYVPRNARAAQITPGEYPVFMRRLKDSQDRATSQESLAPATRQTTATYRQLIETVFGNNGLKVNLPARAGFNSGDWWMENYFEKMFTLFGFTRDAEKEAFIRQFATNTMQLRNSLRGMNIRNDAEIRRFWRGDFTNVVKTDDWVLLNKSWDQSTRVENVDLGTLLGFSVTLTMMDLAKAKDPTSVFNGEYWRKENILDVFARSLNRDEILEVVDNRNKYKIFNESFMLKYHEIFFHALGVEAQDFRRRMASIFSGVLRSSEAYPHLSRNPTTDFIGIYPIAISSIIPMLAGMVNTPYWPRGKSIRDLMDLRIRQERVDLAEFEPMFSAFSRTLKDVRVEVEQMYAGADPDLIERVFQRWLSGQYVVDGRRDGAQVMQVSANELERLDYEKMDADAMFLRHESAANNRTPDLRNMTFDAVSAAVSLKFGKALYWSIYALQNNMVEFRNISISGQSRRVTDISTIRNWLLDLKDILPLTQHLFTRGTRKFNLNDNLDMGTLMGMLRNMKKAGIPARDFKVILQLASHPELQAEAKRVMFSATRHPEWNQATLDLRKPAIIGGVIGWVLHRVQNGMYATRGDADKLVAEFNIPARRSKYFEYANRMRRIWTPNAAMINPADTERVIPEDNTFFGFLLGEPIAFLRANRNPNEAAWTQWTRTNQPESRNNGLREKTIALLQTQKDAIISNAFALYSALEAPNLPEAERMTEARFREQIPVKPSLQGWVIGFAENLADRNLNPNYGQQLAAVIRQRGLPNLMGIANSFWAAFGRAFGEEFSVLQPNTFFTLSPEEQGRFLAYVHDAAGPGGWNAFFQSHGQMRRYFETVTANQLDADLGRASRHFSNRTGQPITRQSVLDDKVHQGIFLSIVKEIASRSEVRGQAAKPKRDGITRREFPVVFGGFVATLLALLSDLASSFGFGSEKQTAVPDTGDVDLFPKAGSLPPVINQNPPQDPTVAYKNGVGTFEALTGKEFEQGDLGIGYLSVNSQVVQAAVQAKSLKTRGGATVDKTTEEDLMKIIFRAEVQGEVIENEEQLVAFLQEPEEPLGGQGQANFDLGRALLDEFNARFENPIDRRELLDQAFLMYYTLNALRRQTGYLNFTQAQLIEILKSANGNDLNNDQREVYRELVNFRRDFEQGALDRYKSGIVASLGMGRIEQGWERSRNVIYRIVAALGNENKRRDILEESQILLDLKQSPGAQSLNLQDGLRDDDPRVVGAIVSIAQFRTSTRLRDPQASWNETSGVLRDLRVAFTRLQADAPLRTKFFSKAAEMYFLLNAEQGAAETDDAFRQRARLYGQNVGNRENPISFFQENNGAWNYLIGYGLAAMTDLKRPLRKKSAGPEMPNHEKLALHTENLTNMMNHEDPLLRPQAVLESYSRNLDLSLKNYNPLERNKNTLRKIVGMYGIRLRMVEEVHGSYDLSAPGKSAAQRIMETLLGVQTVQEAAMGEVLPGQMRWRKISDSEAFYFFQLIYTRSGRESVARIEGVSDVSYSETPGGFSIEHFFEMIHFSENIRKKAAEGVADLVDQGGARLFNMQRGLVPELRAMKNDPSKRKFWMTEGDIDQMIRFIEGDDVNDPQAEEPGLKNNNPTSGEAVQAVTFYLDELIQLHNGQWPGDRRAKQDMLESERLRMYLEAAYMLYHEVDRPMGAQMKSFPARMDMADISNWITLIKQGKYTADQVAGFIRDDGRFEKLEKQLHRDISAELGADAAAKFPMFDAWRRLGFVTRIGFIIEMHKQGNSEQWLTDWFSDVKRIQKASFNATGIFIDPLLISFAVKRFRKQFAKLNLVSEWQLKRFFTTLASTDPFFADLGEEGNRLRRVLLAWQNIHQMAPTPAEIDGLIADWNELDRKVYLAQSTIARQEAAQREYAARMNMVETTFLQSVSEAVYEKLKEGAHRQGDYQKVMTETDLRNELLPALNRLLHDPETGVSGEVMDYVDRNDERRIVREALQDAKIEENRALWQLRNRLFHARVQRASDVRNEWENRTANGVRVLTGMSTHPIPAPLPIDMVDWLKRIFLAMQMQRFGEEMDADSLQSIIDEMKYSGLNLAEVFDRYVVLEREVERIYREVMNLPVTVPLDPATREFVSAMADSLFSDWGFHGMFKDENGADVNFRTRVTETLAGILDKRTDLLQPLDPMVTRQSPHHGWAHAERFPKDIDMAVSFEIHKMKIILGLAKEIQAELTKIGIDLSVSEAFEKARNSYSGGVTIDDIKLWVSIEQKIRASVQAIRIKGLPIDNLSGSEYLYLSDLWVKIGLARLPRQKQLNENRLKVDINFELARLSNLMAEDSRQGTRPSGLAGELLTMGNGRKLDLSSAADREILSTSLAREMKRHAVTAGQLRLLIDKAIEVKKQMDQNRAEAAQLGNFEQQPIAKTSIAIRALSILDVLLYLDKIADPSTRVGLMDGMKMKDSRQYQDAQAEERWMEFVIEPLNSSNRFSASKVLIERTGWRPSFQQHDNLLTVVGMSLLALFGAAAMRARYYLESDPELTKQRQESGGFRNILKKKWAQTSLVSAVVETLKLYIGAIFYFLKVPVRKVLTSPKYWVWFITFGLLGLTLPTLIATVQLSPMLILYSGIAFFIFYASVELIFDGVLRVAQIHGVESPLGLKFLIYRIATALTKAGALSMTVYYGAVINPFSISPIAAAIVLLMAYSLIQTIVEVGVVFFIGNILIGPRRATIQTDLFGETVERRIRSAEMAVKLAKKIAAEDVLLKRDPNMTPQQRKEAVRRWLTESGQGLQVITPFYVNMKDRPDLEMDEISKAIDRNLQSLTSNDHDNIVGVLLLNTPRVNDADFLDNLYALMQKKNIPPDLQKRFTIIMRPGAISKQVAYQLYLQATVTGRNSYDPDLDPEWMEGFSDAVNPATGKKENFISGYFDYSGAKPAIRDLSQAGANEGAVKMIRHEQQLGGVRAEYTTITDADNYLDQDSAWPLLETMINSAPEVNPYDGSIMNGAALFIQPSIRFHNGDWEQGGVESLWALTHQQAQESLWYYQRFMSTALNGVRGFGKFSFHTHQYTQVMLKPYKIPKTQIELARVLGDIEWRKKKTGFKDLFNPDGSLSFDSNDPSSSAYKRFKKQLSKIGYDADALGMPKNLEEVQLFLGNTAFKSKPQLESYYPRGELEPSVERNDSKKKALKVLLKELGFSVAEQGRYVKVVEDTEKWDKDLEEVEKEAEEQLALALQKAESDYQAMVSKTLLKVKHEELRIPYTEKEAVDIRDKAIATAKANQRKWRTETLKKLVTFLKSEDEIHTNVTIQAGSYFQLLDENPGPAWGAIAAITTVALPVIAFFTSAAIIWVAAGALLFYALVYGMNAVIHRDTIPRPSIIKLGIVIAIGTAAALIPGVFLSFTGIPLLFLTASVASLVMNWNRPKSPGAVLREGTPSSVKLEEERELKWKGDFDVKNVWARDQGVVGQDPATAFYNDLVIRGLTSGPRWVLQLVIGWFAVTMLGVIEVGLPGMAEWHFIITMIMLLHMKFSTSFVNYFENLGRIDLETGETFFARIQKTFTNILKSLWRLFAIEIPFRAVETVVSTLVYLPKIIIEWPILIKGGEGLRLNLARQTTPWAVAAQVVTVDTLEDYAEIYATPFSIGFNLLLIFVSSAFFNAGGLTIGNIVAMGAILILTALKLRKILTAHAREAMIKTELKHKKISDEFERMLAEYKQMVGRGETEENLRKLADKLSKLEGDYDAAKKELGLIQRKDQKVYARRAIVGAYSAALFSVALAGNISWFPAIVIGVLAVILHLRYNLKTESEGRVIAGGNISAYSKYVMDQKFELWSSLIVFVPFVISALTITVAPGVAVFADWDFILRALPILFAFIGSPFAAYVASFRFFGEGSERDIKRNSKYVLIKTFLLGYGAIILGIVIMFTPMAQYLGALPIGAQVITGDGSMGMGGPFAQLLKIPAEFTFLHALIFAGSILTYWLFLVLWSWRSPQAGRWFAGVTGSGLLFAAALTGFTLSLPVMVGVAIALVAPLVLGSTLGLMVPLVQKGAERIPSSDKKEIEKAVSTMTAVEKIIHESEKKIQQRLYFIAKVFILLSMGYAFGQALVSNKGIGPARDEAQQVAPRSEVRSQEKLPLPERIVKNISDGFSSVSRKTVSMIDRMLGAKLKFLVYSLVLGFSLAFGAGALRFSDWLNVSSISRSDEDEKNAPLLTKGTVVYTNGPWKVTVQDSDEKNPNNSYIVGQNVRGNAAALALFHGNYQVGAFYGTGYYRFVTAGGPQTVGTQWGPSFVTFGYRPEGGDYRHNAKFTRFGFEQNEKGQLVIRAKVDSEHFKSDDYTFLVSMQNGIYPQANLGFTVDVKQDISLDKVWAQQGAQHFRTGQVSTMNVKGAHDSNVASYVTAQGKQMTQKIPNQGFVFPKVEAVAPGSTLLIENTDRRVDDIIKIYRNTPDVFIALGEGMDAKNFFYQGWVTPSRDPNDDNVGFFVGANIPTELKAGQSFSYNFNLGVRPPQKRSEARQGVPASRSEVREIDWEEFNRKSDDLMNERQGYRYNPSKAKIQGLSGGMVAMDLPGRSAREQELGRPIRDTTPVVSSFDPEKNNFNKIAKNSPLQVLGQGTLAGKEVRMHINYAPYVNPQFLIIPAPDENKPQVLDADSLNVALAAMVGDEALPQNANLADNIVAYVKFLQGQDVPHNLIFRKGDDILGFNSLGAGASVNHLHFHKWQEPAGSRLIDQSTDGESFVTANGVKVSRIENYPVNGRKFQLGDLSVYVLPRSREWNPKDENGQDKLLVSPPAMMEFSGRYNIPESKFSQQGLDQTIKTELATLSLGDETIGNLDQLKEIVGNVARAEVRRDDRDIRAKERDAAIELQLEKAVDARARALSEAVKSAATMRQEIALGQILASIKSIPDYKNEMAQTINETAISSSVKAIVINFNEADGSNLNFVLDVLAKLPEEVKLSVIADADEIKMLRANADVNAAIGAGQLLLNSDLIKEVDELKLKLEVADNQSIGQTFIDGPVGADDLSIVQWAQIRAAQLTDKTILILGGTPMSNIAQIKISEVLRAIENEIRSELRVKASA